MNDKRIELLREQARNYILIAQSKGLSTGVEEDMIDLASEPELLGLIRSLRDLCRTPQ